MSRAISVHPFPAKMAPEIVAQYIEASDEGAVVLDPMMGSGTFLLQAVASGRTVLGFDSDPLAVLITRAAASSVEAAAVIARAHEIVAQRKTVRPSDIVSEDETLKFIDFWFDEIAQARLATLAQGIAASPRGMQPVLWCAFSRLIITKDAGASRARDVSHSRPHIVRAEASFDPLDRFIGAVQAVLQRRSGFSEEQLGRMHVGQADARVLPLATGAVDAVMTSPPYLTAIDYLRGHRMSLVWMGHTVGELRRLRSANIGTERGAADSDVVDRVREGILDGTLSDRRRKVVNRYLGDLSDLLSELARVTRIGGTATFVVANSNHGGTEVRVDDAIALLGTQVGWSEAGRRTRSLPSSSRYLPPPTRDGSALGSRMRRETILTLARS